MDKKTSLPVQQGNTVFTWQTAEGTLAYTVRVDAAEIAHYGDAVKVRVSADMLWAKSPPTA